MDVSINNLLMFYSLYLKGQEKSLIDEMKKNIAIMQAVLDELDEDFKTG